MEKILIPASLPLMRRRRAKNVILDDTASTVLAEQALRKVRRQFMSHILVTCALNEHTLARTRTSQTSPWPRRMMLDQRTSGVWVLALWAYSVDSPLREQDFCQVLVLLARWPAACHSLSECVL